MLSYFSRFVQLTWTNFSRSSWMSFDTPLSFTEQFLTFSSNEMLQIPLVLSSVQRWNQIFSNEHWFLSLEIIFGSQGRGAKCALMGDPPRIKLRIQALLGDGARASVCVHSHTHWHRCFLLMFKSMGLIQKLQSQYNATGFSFLVCKWPSQLERNLSSIILPIYIRLISLPVWTWYYGHFPHLAQGLSHHQNFMKHLLCPMPGVRHFESDGKWKRQRLLGKPGESNRTDENVTRTGRSAEKVSGLWYHPSLS